MTAHPDQPDPDQRPVTGDRVVDDALAVFEEALTAEPAAQLAAATRAHRVLQARLTEPSTAPSPKPLPAPPGEGPGPQG